MKLGGKKSRPKQFVDVDDSAGVLAELILKSIGQARHKEVGPADIRRGRHKEVGGCKLLPPHDPRGWVIFLYPCLDQDLDLEPDLEPDLDMDGWTQTWI